MEMLTDQEKAAILYHVYTGFKDREILFKIAEGENRYNRLKETSRRQTIHVWFNSEKIQNGIKEITFQVEQKKRDIQEKAILAAKTETSDGTRPAAIAQNVNFLNPDEFLKFASQKANELQDEKEKREYLKMIANLMNYKDSDREETEMQRFYTPVTCLECAIYRKCKGCKVTDCPEVTK
jgi:hypothetical protein